MCFGIEIGLFSHSLPFPLGGIVERELEPNRIPTPRPRSGRNGEGSGELGREVEGEETRNL